MSPIQQMFLGAGGAAKKTYMDDVFSTYLFKGNAGTQAINNGIDLAGEGGLVWTKNRTSTFSNFLYDTERGVQKYLISDSPIDQQNVSTSLTAFNSNGFTLGANDYGNITNGNQATSWSFRKAPGFFDVVTYTGNSTFNTPINHLLGSIPGMILIKCTSTASTNWIVYHRNTDSTSPADYGLRLNLANAKFDSSGFFADTKPTATQFFVGNNDTVNYTNRTYVAYVFAGGESTAATARSCVFPNTASTAALESSSSNYDFGTGDFTIECWFKYDDNSSNILVDKRTSSNTTDVVLYIDNNFAAFYQGGSNRITSYALMKKEWYHLALVRSSGTTKMYVNGVFQGTYSDTTNYNSTAVHIGSEDNGANCLNGSISNLRIVKGTAVYTSSFRPPTEPLTNITNTKLLCCNNSSITGTTVGTVTGSDATASTDSPFDDPAGFKFGESELENVIKCGSYEGNSTANHEIYVGWEPQWWLVKNVTDSQNWQLLDSMRGWVNDGNDQYLVPNSNAADSGYNFGNPTPTGFNLSSASSNWQNVSGKTYVYMAIRRPDGYVGKPSELGTNVFAMDTGNGSATIPAFDSGFPVDFQLNTKPGSSWSKYAGSRLTQGKYLVTSGTSAESSSSEFVYDSNVGWSKGSANNSSYQSWMWKRHAGFDVVTYRGNSTAGRQLPHSLSQTPEMFWVRPRTGAGAANQNWRVYHKGLNGGTNPEQYYLGLDQTNPESSHTQFWNDTAPTSTHVTLGSSTEGNANNYTYLMMLFASVDGISKVGSYSGSSSDVFVNLGFQPRFMIVKAYNSASGNQRWQVMDTLRGMAAGATATNRIYLDDSQAQQAGPYVTSVSSTGITLKTGYTYSNTNNYEYIYYAHA